MKTKTKRRICVVTGNRAEYSRVKSVMNAVKGHPDLELIVVVTASHLLRRYGNTVEEIERDGFLVHERVYLIVEGENPVTMAKSTGLGIIELATVLNNWKPDVVVAPTDRFETLSVAIAASFMNIYVAHIQGGEVTGSIDESIRHAITKFSHLHFPATEKSRQRIIQMGEPPSTVFNVGCPATDVLLQVPLGTREEMLQTLQKTHVKDNTAVDPTQPYLLVVQHPVTTEFGNGYQQIQETLYALEKLPMQVVMVWPNVDAGSEEIVTGIRHFLLKHRRNDIFIFRHLEYPLFVQLVAHAACMIGNSSAGIRESCYFGTPVVDIGLRQQGRERGKNVLNVGYDRDAIQQTTAKQISRGRYPVEMIYGDGTAGEKICEVLTAFNFNGIQKRLTY